MLWLLAVWDCNKDVLKQELIPELNATLTLGLTETTILQAITPLLLTLLEVQQTDVIHW